MSIARGKDIQALSDARQMRVARRYPVTFVRGRGAHLYDDEGNEYLDFFAGIAVTGLGHAHPRVTEAVAKQVAELVHVSNYFYTRPAAELAERLCELLGFKDGRVFFTNSGAESNECAIKVVRKWSRDKYGPERYETIAALGSFHGRTFETLAATGQPKKWEPFSPLPPGFVHVPYDDSSAIEAAISDRTCSVLLEPVLGEGGVIVPSDRYLPAVRKVCDARNLAFIADEVQTGFGRTGEWFGFQHGGFGGLAGPFGESPSSARAGVPPKSTAVPDVISLAKALGNGLPIGACVARGEMAEAFGPGDHGSTFGGGPVVCSAALAVIDVMEKEGLVERARLLGEYLQGSLRKLVDLHPLAAGVRGRGLLIALQLSEEVARDVTTRALKAGLVINDVAPSAIRLAPPLIVTEEDCDRAVQILDQVLTDAEKVIG